MIFDPRTNMAIPDQKDHVGNISNDKDMIALHHYFISIDTSERIDKNFPKTFLIE